MDELRSLKEAIVDLYLAIKIRSAEEVSIKMQKYSLLQLEQVNEESLKKEKEKLLTKDGFVILEYIRSSIEIIMSLKIQDLEKDNNHHHQGNRVTASKES